MSHSPKFSLPIFIDIPKMYFLYALILAYSPNFSSPIAFTCVWFIKNFPHQNFPICGRCLYFVPKTFMHYCFCLLQVICKCLYLIGQVLATLLQPDVGVAADLATGSSGCGLLSSIAESLQLCSMDINWEIRDSCIELIGSLANEQSK